MTAARASMTQVIAEALGWDWSASQGVPSGVECVRDVARALEAAGFGDVAQAKAEALEEASRQIDPEHQIWSAFYDEPVGRFLDARADEYRK